MKKVLKIDGMMCNKCVAHVEKALSALDGVTVLEVNLKKHTATVETETVADETLVQAVVDAGYEVKGIK